MASSAQSAAQSAGRRGPRSSKSRPWSVKPGAARSNAVATPRWSEAQASRAARSTDQARSCAEIEGRVGEEEEVAAGVGVEGRVAVAVELGAAVERADAGGGAD